MEKDKAAVVSKQAAKNFEEKQKLTSMVQTESAHDAAGSKRRTG